MEATIAERGQVVIPKAIRDQLGMKPGTLLTFHVDNGKLIVRKKVDDAISRARGVLKLEPGEDLDQWWRDVRGRAPSDPIEPWEKLRDDCYIPAAIREDHAKRRAAWLSEQSAGKKIANKRATKITPAVPAVPALRAKRSTKPKQPKQRKPA